MKKITRAHGQVTYRVPGNASDIEDVTGQQDRSRGMAREGTSPEIQATSLELHMMLDALGEADAPLDSPVLVIDRFIVDVGNGVAGQSGTPRSPAASDEQDALDINVDLAPGESAVILIEQDGTFEWHFPENVDDKIAGARSASRRIDVHFHIPVGNNHAPLPTRKRGTRAHRGPITNFIRGKITGVILKFIARKTVGALSRRLERGVQPGPVLINSASDAMAWQHLPAWPTDSLPTNRPARVLLLVHGTFSSTLGSFGTLLTHTAGRHFMEQALSQYDMVIGYDHHTLADTPQQNAEDLYASLVSFSQGTAGLEVDSIAFSRGGLVFRYLSEQIAASAPMPIQFNSAVFIACTNAGTELASDGNWKSLVDLYTNMLAGATRLIGLAPGAAVPTRILREGIRSIGSLVTYIAQVSVADNAVPGIAAMEPRSEFIRAINEIPQVRSRPGANAYYTLGSNFEPSSASSSGRLGKRLVFNVADGVVDRLMGKHNDLVVNTDSMFTIDPVPGARHIEQRKLEANDRVYHTVYFSQSLVVQACSGWLLRNATPGSARPATDGVADNTA